MAIGDNAPLVIRQTYQILHYILTGRICAHTHMRSFLLYINVFTDPIKTLIDFTEQFQNGYTGFERFMEIINIEPDIQDKEDAVELKNVKGDNKKVIIAVPVDRLSFQGDTLVACFVEIDMDNLLSGISLQSNNNTTFCNIYTKDGISLANMVLAGLASEDNLLEALENASFEEGFGIETPDRKTI